MPNIQQQTSDDRFLVIALKQDDKQAFTRLFHAYYKDLVLFGGTYIPEKSTCEDIVQNIFLKLWNDRKSLVIENSLKSYLLKAVRNYLMNLLFLLTFQLVRDKSLCVFLSNKCLLVKII